MKNQISKTELSVSIGIPAYYAEMNIGNLLQSLINQRQKDFTLYKIIVYYDKSGDNTIREAKKVKSEKIEIIEGSTRKGFANGIKTLLQLNKSNLIILLNDDIKITDNLFVNKLIQPFIEEEKVGLVCGNPQPLPPKSFIDKALASRLKASELLSYKINNGNNLFSCDGKTLVLSKDFIKQLKFPQLDKLAGNVDAYLYFACLTLGFTFRFVKDANVYYRNPTTWSDYSKWISRNNSQKYILMKTFNKELIAKEYFKPKGLMLKTLFAQFVSNPLGSAFIVSTEVVNILKAKTQMKNLSSTWDLVITTKNLN